MLKEIVFRIMAKRRAIVRGILASRSNSGNFKIIKRLVAGVERALRFVFALPMCIIMVCSPVRGLRCWTTVSGGEAMTQLQM